MLNIDVHDMFTLTQVSQDLLGIDIKTLYRKMDRLGIVPMRDADDARLRLLTGEQVQLLDSHLEQRRKRLGTTTARRRPMRGLHRSDYPQPAMWHPGRAPSRRYRAAGMANDPTSQSSWLDDKPAPHGIRHDDDVADGDNDLVTSVAQLRKREAELERRIGDFEKYVADIKSEISAVIDQLVAAGVLDPDTIG
jgi:hypothetical protein